MTAAGSTTTTFLGLEGGTNPRNGWSATSTQRCPLAQLGKVHRLPRLDLSDAEWERLRPFLPISNGRCGRWRDQRQVIDALLHRVRTRVQWRDLPERFGPWKTVYERHRLWSADGTWERLLQQVQAAADAAGEVDWNISVDSTIVRAHHHVPGRAATGPGWSGRRWPTTGLRRTPSAPSRWSPRAPSRAGRPARSRDRSRSTPCGPIRLGGTAPPPSGTKAVRPARASVRPSGPR